MKTVETQEHTRHKDTGAAFHAVMREISIPLHRRHEIDVVSFGNSLHDPDCYYLIHAFDSAENMTAVLDAFMLALTGATAHVKTSLAAQKPALKQ